MNTAIPSVEVVRAQLLNLPDNGLKTIAAQSGVPFTTLWKIRAGETANPGIETVRKFYPFLPAAINSDAANHPTPPHPAAVEAAAAFQPGA